jgi:hypothetical protein
MTLDPRLCMSQSLISSPASDGRTHIRNWRRFVTAQRVIVVTFALVEAVGISWAIVHTLLRDVPR